MNVPRAGSGAGQTPGLLLATAVEEGLEMFGVIVLLAALLFYMRRSQAGAGQPFEVGGGITEPGR